MAALSCRRLLAHCVRCAARRAPANAGINSAISTPMIMITVSNSTRENPVNSTQIARCAIISWLLPCGFAFAQSPATQSIDNGGGRDPSILPDSNSPGIRQVPAARSIKKLQAAPLYSFNETDVDAYV